MIIQINDIDRITQDEYHHWFSLMSTEKKNRIQRLKHMEDRKRSVVGEMIVRELLSQYDENLDSEHIVFQTDIKGKPYVPNSTFHFNISHSGKLVAVAIDQRPIGIDIELVSDIPITVAMEFCSNNELRYVGGQSAIGEFPFLKYYADPLDRLYEVWTIKEAYLKYTGQGITEDVGIDLATCLDTLHVFSTKKSGYMFSVVSETHLLSCSVLGQEEL